MTIATRGLVKRYGDHVALDRVDLAVSPGMVYGLVGANGAGKTTLLSILAGLRRPTSGSVHVEADRSQVAVLPDAPRFEPWLTGREVVSLAAHLAGRGRARIDEVLAGAGLADAASRRVGGYSRGMLQRLGIAATVVPEPRVLLLDEPAAALDPGGRRDVLDLVRRLRGEATVVFSSHILADVQEVSDWVGILDRGRLLFQGPVADLLVHHAAPTYLVTVRLGLAEAEGALRRCPWVHRRDRLDDRTLRVRVASLEEAEAGWAAALAGSGARVVSVRPQALTLEDVFLEVTR
ncbi:MAG: ABC transporter ATP-binding protein [Actinomycetota bacterium]